MTYKHIGGSIFKGSKQLMIIVAVEASPKLVDTIAEEVVATLKRKSKRDRLRKSTKSSDST
jgi:hypothetical protein